ncbi:LysR family transcriptional regulator [Hahella sp. CCB-MM4]|uniref:LysR family transcriptional regulator n=1 Tax=Hahella sp. (strain CCB-MM4) TaxID=1926491 RepID=UPI000B9C1C6D|nr:LysR family transcriptional regulator [Hahella sp. CCB-MM4]OZG70016.1 LysR family transcriptional regulator [Hahella sp. CCB-MM4]
MAEDIGWELYRSFLGVLQEGSLSGAARALGLTQPTIGRHISALEKQLKLTLFTRSQTGLLPTEAARSLRGFAEEMASTAAALARAAASQGAGISGVVRITASDVIGVEVLPPIIARLRRNHPHLQIELVLSNRVQDLMTREADIAVRMIQPRQAQLIARSIGKIELGLHATQDYLDRYGYPESLGDLEQHTLIGFDRPTAFTREAMKSLPGLEREMFSLRSDSDLAQLAMIRAGAGVGVCQVALARQSRDLHHLLPDQLKLHLDTWITMHEDLRNHPPCRAAFDALVEGMLEYRDLQ